MFNRKQNVNSNNYYNLSLVCKNQRLLQKIALLKANWPTSRLELLEPAFLCFYHALINQGARLFYFT